MKKISAVLILFAITFCSPSGKQAETKPVSNSVAEGISSGTYKLDKSHASLIFKVNHMGFSNYTARFKRFDAELKFDPKKPADSQVTATIDPTSIETDYPDGFSWILHDRCRLYSVGQKQSDSGRSRSGFRCGFVGGLCVKDYRS